jgi:hypothetical protein
VLKKTKRLKKVKKLKYHLMQQRRQWNILFDLSILVF